MSFAENLNYLLKDTYISQYQLALAIGYSQRAVSKWINGQAEPSATAIIKCAEYFNVSTDFLLSKEDYDFKKNSNSALHVETVDNSKISNFNMRFGEILKGIRHEKGLTQFELAQKLNIDQTTISKWELNKALPDTTMLLKLANLFNVSTDYLLQRTSYYFPDTISQELDEQEQELIDCYRKLSPYLQGLALETMRGWSGEGKDSKKADILSKNKRA